MTSGRMRSSVNDSGKTVVMQTSRVTYEKGRLYQISMNELQADPNQPRKFMDSQALDDLAASIAQHGVLTPILFRTVIPSPSKDAPPSTSSPANAAARPRKRAGLTEVPAILVEEQAAFAASLGELKKTILALLKTKPATTA
jgi:hypothetical protein